MLVVYLILLGGDVQRSVSILGGCVRRSTFIQEEQGHTLVVVVAGHVQRRHTVLKLQSDRHYITFQTIIMDRPRHSGPSITLPCASTGASFCSRSLATFMLPYLAARWSGVKPRFVVAVFDAPCSSRTAATCPDQHHFSTLKLR